ncbi:MAG: hypothetical protein HQL30_09570 [Candidatus Omnitrophica bacterium]|nr:hypothetical protein [Candidatus Omnitrophota bacterium]
MKRITGIKLFVGLLLALFAIMFFVENMDPVPIYFPIFKGRRFGLIFIMGFSYIMGMASMFFIMTKIGGKLREMRKKKEAMTSPEEEELFDEEEH